MEEDTPPPRSDHFLMALFRDWDEPAQFKTMAGVLHLLLASIGNAYGENEMTMVATTLVCPAALAPRLRTTVPHLPDFVSWWDLMRLLGETEDVRAVRVLTLALLCFDSRVRRFLCTAHAYHAVFRMAGPLPVDDMLTLVDRERGVGALCEQLVARVSAEQHQHEASAVPYVLSDMDAIVGRARTLLHLPPAPTANPTTSLPLGLFHDLE